MTKLNSLIIQDNNHLFMLVAIHLQKNNKSKISYIMIKISIYQFKNKTNFKKIKKAQKKVYTKEY